MTGQPFVTINHLDNGKYQIKPNSWIVVACGIINKRYMHTPTWPHPAFSFIEREGTYLLGELNTLEEAEKAFKIVTESAVKIYMASGIYGVPGSGTVSEYN